MITLIGLSQNIAMLLSLTFIYGLIAPRLERLSARLQSGLRGVVFGFFAVISMTVPIQVIPGLFYDGRTIVICIAGLYGGAIPAVIAALMVAAVRLWIGGVGVPGALVSVITAASISIGLYRYFQPRQTEPSPWILLLVGVVLALTGTAWAIIFSGVALSVVTTMLPTTLIAYPLGVLLLGELVIYQQRSRTTERALRDNERRFRALFNSSFQFTGLLKPDGTVIETNQTALDFCGIELADVVGRPYWETHWWTISIQTKAALQDAIRRAAQGEFVRYEVDVWGAEKRVITIDFSLKPLHDDDGKVALLIPEGRDISARKELEQQKLDLVLERERARLLKKFISDVSHDLRTPLSVIRLNLELLRRANDPLKVQQRVEILAAQEQHLTRLLTDMMTMLSLDDEQATFAFKPLDLNFVIQLVIDANHKAALNKQQTLTFNHPAEPLMVQADQVELERAFGKLLINALTYTPKGGAISVTVLRDGDNSVRVEINDTGIGISADDLPNIFQRFFRADQARSINNGGSGLGLPIAKKIVEVHGGTIEVESTPEVGSTFRVSLPLAAPEADAATDSLTDTAAATG